MSEHKPLYRVILKRAWHLTWSHRELWIFGFFATFLQTAGVVEIMIKAWSRVSLEGWNAAALLQSSYPGAAFVSGLAAGATEGVRIDPSALVPIVIVLAIFVALFWFVSASEGALVWAAGGGKKKLPAIEDSFAHGRSQGWRIALAHVFSKLLLAALFIVTSLPLILVATEGTYRNLALYFISFLIFFPLALIVSFMTIYAVCAMVISKQHFFHAVHTAWHLFRTHWLISIETALILFVVSLAGGLAVAILALLLAVPVSLLIVAAFIVGSTTAFGVVATVGVLIVIIFALLVGAIVTTYQLITWTLLYERLARRGGVSKFVRILRAIPKFIFHRV
ncbi:hypothetical protein HY478_00730 [Candidatus Uhrbacteria bacterium]|nr:hypothetical protein [Candidatus Uhrbacteria bacterium]